MKRIKKLSVLALVCLMALSQAALADDVLYQEKLLNTGFGRLNSDRKVSEIRAAECRVGKYVPQWRPTRFGRAEMPPSGTLLHTNQSLLGQRGALNYNAGALLQSKLPVMRDVGLLNQRSNYFHGSRRPVYRNIPAHIPGVESHIRTTLAYYFQVKGAQGLKVHDRLAKQDWSLRMACTPTLKKISNNSYIAQVPCYGTLGSNATQYPVVLQFQMTGADRIWTVGRPQVAAANRICRDGHTMLAEFWPEDLPAEAAQEAVQTTTPQQ